MKNYLLLIFSLIFFLGNTNTTIRYNPSSKFEKLIKKANTLEQEKNFLDAIAIYNQALKIALDQGLSTDKSFIHNKIGKIYRKLKKGKKAQFFFKLSVKSDSLSKYAASSYHYLSYLKRKENQQDSTLFFLKRALNIYDKIDQTKDSYNIYLYASTIYKNQGIYDNALKYGLKAYEGFKVLNNEKKKAIACKNIGNILVAHGDSKLGKEYFQEAIEVNKQLKDTVQISYCYSLIGNAFKKEELYDIAIENYIKALEVQKGLKIKKEAGKILNNLAVSYYLNQNYVKAEETYNKALSIKKVEKDTLSYSYTYNELASIALNEDKLGQAKKYLDSSALFLTNIHNKDILLRNYEVQSQYYESIRDYKLALEFREKYVELYEQLFNDTLVSKTNQITNELKYKRNKSRIKELTTIINLKEFVISNQKKLFFIILCLIVILGFLAYRSFKQRQNAKIKVLELERMKAVFQGQEVIKNNISKDLHDIISTNYDGIRLKILAMSQAENPTEISKEIVSEIKDVNQQIRLISHRLSPLGDKIREASLREIIVAQLSEFQFYRKIFVNIQMPLPRELDSLKLDAQTNFYGIFLEVLNNISKHSQATTIEIKHTILNSNILELIISDNGIGNAKKNETGIGITNMKQRSYLLGGECQIKHTSSGTTVNITFPIKRNT